MLKRSASSEREQSFSDSSLIDHWSLWISASQGIGATSSAEAVLSMRRELVLPRLSGDSVTCVSNSFGPEVGSGGPFFVGNMSTEAFVRSPVLV